MYRWVAILVLPVLLIDAEDGKLENVVKISKLVDIRSLSLKDFYRLNAGHIIYNYFSDLKDEKDHLKTFHDLDYAGPVSIGEPGQTLNVFFDLASADFLVMSATHCSFVLMLFSSMCRSRRSFDETSSYKDASMREYAWKEAMTPYFQWEYEKATLSGYLIRDKVKIANKELPPQVIGLIEGWEYGFGYSRADGIMGLGQKELSKFVKAKGVTHIHPDNLAEVTRDQLPMKETLRKEKIPKLGFHLFLNKKREVGHLVLGTEGDDWRRKTDLMWIDQNKETPYWYLPLTLIKMIHMANGDVGAAIPISTPYSVIDPGVSLFVGPPQTIEQIHQSIFRGMKKFQYTNKDGAVKFDCRYKDQLPILAFVINDRGFLLDPSDYVRELKDSCSTGFMSMEKLPFFIIGDTFMRKFYTVFNNEPMQVGLAESIAPK